MTDTSPAPVTARFPHRSRRGILLGLSLPQLLLTAATLALLMLTVVTAGLSGIATLLPLWAAIAAVTFIRRGGRSLIDWAPVLVRYLLRRLRGQLLWLARPSTRPRAEGLLHLPGTDASLRVVTSPDKQLAGLYDAQAGTLTAIARVSSRAFALLDPATQNAHVNGWGRTLASLARSGHIGTVQVLERTVPDSGDALQRHVDEHGEPEHAPLATGIYTDLVAAAGPAAAPHETYIALALDLKAARRLINQAGGGLTGTFTVLSQTTSTFTQSARNAGLSVTRWLNAREIAAVMRTAYDPGALPALQQWSTTGSAEADPAAAGPVLQIEETDRVRTDTALHATYWVENWPRTETSPGFLHGLLFSAGVRRTFSLTYRPQPLEAALRDVQRRKSTIISDAAERRRRGQVDSEEDSVEYRDVKTREKQLIAGHADTALTGLLTVSAETDEQLDAACAQIETAAVSAQVDLRRLALQQTEAFALSALPLARTAL